MSQFCLDSDIHRYFENHDIFKNKTNQQEQQTHGRRQASVNLAICTQEREGQIQKEEQEETFRKEEFTQPKQLTRAVNKEYKHATGTGRQKVEILAKLILLLTEINNKDRNYDIRITAKNILKETSNENIKNVPESSTQLVQLYPSTDPRGNNNKTGEQKRKPANRQ